MAIPSANGGTTYPGKKKPKIPSANNGGVTAPGGKPKVGSTPFNITLPTFTYDPSLEAEKQKAASEEKNRLHEIATQQHFNTTDLHTGLGDIERTRKRGFEDTNKSFRRESDKVAREQRQGGEKIGRDRSDAEERLGNQESDTRLNATRQQQDFTVRRQELARQFGDLGQKQSEAQNASGTLDQGTSAAAAAARVRNQQISEAPIATAEGRLNEDLATALGRITTSRGKVGTEADRQSRELTDEGARVTGELGEDHSTSLGRLLENAKTEREGKKREIGRSEHKLGEKEQEVKQAGVEANQSALMSELYEFKENHPGAFEKWAEEHPNIAQTVEGLKGDQGGKSSGGGKRPSGSSNNNGGTTAPSKKKKGRR